MFSRWAYEDTFFAFETLMRRMLAAYRNIPIEVKLRIDAKDLDMWTGDLFTLRHRNVVDAAGRVRDTIMRVIEVQENKAGTWSDITAREAEREFAEGRYCYFREETSLDFTSTLPDDREFLGGWFCDDTTLVMPDGSGPYLFP
jgi:hypothetical protein